MSTNISTNLINILTKLDQVDATIRSSNLLFSTTTSQLRNDCNTLEKSVKRLLENIMINDIFYLHYLVFSHINNALIQADLLVKMCNNIEYDKDKIVDILDLCKFSHEIAENLFNMYNAIGNKIKNMSNDKEKQRFDTVEALLTTMREYTLK